MLSRMQEHLRMTKTDENAQDFKSLFGGIRVDSRHLVSLAGFAIVLLAWQISAQFSGLPETIYPKPTTVWNEIIAQWGLLVEHSYVTLKEILWGFGLAILIGVPLAIAMTFIRALDNLFLPVLVVMNSVPKVAIAPLLVLWLGYGTQTNVFLSVLVAVFPIIINTVVGLKTIDDELIKLGKVMGGNAMRIFFRIRLNSALPSIFAGLKLGITLATIGAIFGEMIAGQKGVGYLAQYAASQLLTPLAFACIVAMSVLGVVLFYLVVLLENIVVKS